MQRGDISWTILGGGGSIGKMTINGVCYTNINSKNGVISLTREGVTTKYQGRDLQSLMSGELAIDGRPITETDDRIISTSEAADKSKVAQNDNAELKEQSPAPTPQKKYDYKSVNDLLEAIEGNEKEDEIAKFLNERTHLEDKDGAVLYYAINGGLNNLVDRILNDSKIVLDIHFYVAGLSVKSLGHDKSKKMYDTLKKYSSEEKNADPVKITSPGLHGQDVPDTEVKNLVEAVKGGKIDKVIQFIGTGAHRRDLKGSALYHALALGHKNIILKLLNAGVEVKDKHIYASGLSIQQVGKEYKAKSFYAMLTDYRKLPHDINAEEAHPHLILGVAPKAGEEQIKHQYRKLAKLYHPDQNKKVDPAIANMQFRKLKEAYDKLMIPFQPPQYHSSQAPGSP